MLAKRLVTSEEVAEDLHVGPATVRQYARRGRIPFVTTPGGHRRYDLEAVRRALANAPPIDETGDDSLSDGHWDEVGPPPPKAVMEVATELTGIRRASAAAVLTDEEWEILLSEDGIG